MGIRIYIAGPMRGYDEFNFPAFMAADKRLFEKYGNDIEKMYNPAAMDEENGLDVSGTTGDMVEIPEFNLNKAMAENCIAICDCTHIYMLKGWEKSSGAIAEWNLAKMLDLEFMYE